MQTKDHCMLAKYMAEQYNISNPPRRAAFVLGNIMPDIDKLSYIQGYVELRKCAKEKAPKSWRISHRERLTFNDHRCLLIGGHTAEGSRKYINRRYRQLREKDEYTVLDYYRMGKMLHYLTDRFTHPHSMEYRDGFFAHVDFEERLHRISVILMPYFARVSTKKVPPIPMETLYRAYRSETPDPFNDYMYIITAYTNCMNKLVHT